MLAAAAMLPCATAFAGGYDTAANRVSVDASKKTVIIARNTGTAMTDDDIVCIAQSNYGVFDAASFMLKENPAVGFYTIMLGGDGNAATKGTFFIGSAE